MIFSTIQFDLSDTFQYPISLEQHQTVFNAMENSESNNFELTIRLANHRVESDHLWCGH